MQNAMILARRQGIEAALRAMHKVLCGRDCRHFDDGCWLLDKQKGETNNNFKWKEATFKNCPLVGQTRKELEK